MRIAICDDSEIQIDIFMHRINNFLKRNGDIKALITPYDKGQPLIDDVADGEWYDIVVLDMPLLDTRRGKDLMGTFLSDIVLQVLSFVAENERTNIRQRQAEGIAAAKASGKRFGRPPSALPENFHSVYQRWKSGKITGTAAAKECGMPLSTFRYRAEIYEKAKL